MSDDLFTTVHGDFDVVMQPQPLAHDAADPLMGRRSLDKTYRGPLQGQGRGEMLSAGTAVAGSAGYVAIEQVSATLAGRSGSFVLQHSGTLNRGQPTLSIQVVPDSGTGGLVGLRGSMDIQIQAGAHHYSLRYSLPAGG